MLPGKISGSLNVRAELITKWLLSLNRWDTETEFVAVAIAKFSVKEVSEKQRNQLGSDGGAKFLKFITDSLITGE